ncbi:MAG: FemAB family XrtA/PEP-CTERM system-associated protein [Gemmatimonadota bacterium]
MTPTMTRTDENMVVTPLADAAEWDAFVEETPGATFCHLSAWRGIIERAMRQRTCYAVARAEDGGLRGVLPLVRLSSPLFGARLVSVPYLNDGGAVGDPDAIAALHAHAIGLAASAGGRLELRLRSLPPGAPATHPGTSHGKVTVLLDLPAEPEQLWSAIPAKVRSQVRRPQKAGMTVRFGLDQVPAFYGVWAENMRDLGTPVLPRSFFDEIASALPERFVVGCVYRDDVPVAAGAGFLFRGELEITWASSLRSHNRDAPNMLLYWEFMQQAIRQGAGVFNFGRCTPGGGTHRFKLQWGGRTVPLPWVQTGAGAGDDAGASPGRAARLASTLWQRLPVAVANRVGPVVARQLPWW